jgi:hypothetical protein
VDAYAGMPDVFFTWVRRVDKRIRFEFLDNSVAFGELPRTVAFGTNFVLNVLDAKGLLDIVRYGRVNVDATGPQSLYPDRRLLEPEHNMTFLQRCIDGFQEVNFADQATGRIYLRIRSGQPVMMDDAALQSALEDPDTLASVRAVAPAVFGATVAVAERAEYLLHLDEGRPVSTLGQWGSATR